METASSDALVQLQMLQASCSLVLALDDNQTIVSHVAAILQLACSTWASVPMETLHRFKPPILQPQTPSITTANP